MTLNSPSPEAKPPSNRPVYDAILLLAGRSGQIVAGFCLIFVGSRLMDPSGMAVVSQISSLAGFVQGTLLAAVVNYVLRHQVEWQARGVLRAHLARAAGYFLTVALVAAALATTVQALSKPIPSTPPWLVGVPILLFALFSPLSLTGASGLNVLGRRLPYTVFNNLSAWGGAVLAVTAFLLLGREPGAWALGINLGYIAGAFSFLLFFRASGPDDAGAVHDNGLRPRAVANFASYQTIGFAAWWLQSQSYRFILASYGEAHFAGLLATAQMFTTQAMQAVVALLNDYFMPRIMRGQRSGESVGPAFANAMAPAVFLAGSFLAAAGPVFARTFLGEDFRAVGAMIGATAAFDTLWGLYSILYLVSVARKDMKPSIYPVLLGGLLAPLLTLVAIRFFPSSTAAFLSALGVAYLGMGGVTAGLLARSGIVFPIRLLAKVALACAPLVAMAIWLPFQHLSMVAALALGAVALLYMVAAQYAFARPWLSPASA